MVMVDVSIGVDPLTQCWWIVPGVANIAIFLSGGTFAAFFLQTC